MIPSLASRIARAVSLAALCGLCLVTVAEAANPVAPAPVGTPPTKKPAAQAPAAPAAETPFDAASRQYEEGKQKEALVTLQRLAEAGDARAQYLVGLDLIEGQFIPRDNARGFAYIVLASEDTQFGDLVAPRAKEARALIEPQLSGQDLIHADALIAAYRQQHPR